MTLCYDDLDMCLLRYVDSDFTVDVDSRKSITSYVFTLGSRAVNWMSRLQKIVTFSTIDAEYVTGT